MKKEERHESPISGVVRVRWFSGEGTFCYECDGHDVLITRDKTSSGVWIDYYDGDIVWSVVDDMLKKGGYAVTQIDQIRFYRQLATGGRQRIYTSWRAGQTRQSVILSGSKT